MKEDLKQMQRHERVMEMESVQKNGASLKRHTSRGNLIKNVLTAAMLLYFCAFTNKAVGQTWNIGHPGYNSNVKATLSGGTLTISGSGNMVDFWNSTEGEAPWWKDNKHTSIKTVIIQSGVTNIGNRAFKDCSILESVQISNTVMIIGRRAFDNCSNLPLISIPNSVTEIEGGAFYNCPNLRTVTIENGTGLLRFTSFINGISNEYDWFKSCPVQTLHLGKNIEYPSSYPPFKGIINAASSTLTIGNNVTSIGGDAFNGCRGLTSITIPASVTSIGTAAFANCNSLNNVTIADGTTNLTIETSMFGSYHCFYETPVKILHLGRNITFSSASYPTFKDKTTLTNLTIGNNVISIDANVFSGCSGLTSVTIPNSVTKIGNSAFSGCTGLTSISIPTSITSIGADAFNGCRGLTSITIPNSVTSIGTAAFANCNSLSNVTIADGTTNLAIETSMFVSYHCFYETPVKTLHLGRNITFSTTSYPTFKDKTTLTDLTIGSNITDIANNSFSGCTRITQITSNAATPPIIYANTFNGLTKTIPVKAPFVATYQYSDWGQVQGFSNFVQTGTCPNASNAGTLTVLSSNVNLGHATSTSMQSGLTLTSTWDFGGNFTPVTSVSFSGKAILVASAKGNSVFSGWNDGNLEPMRIVDIAANANATYTANFTTCSSLSSISNVPAENGITVYSNPAKDEIFIQSEQPVEKVEVLDISGRTIETRHVASLQSAINVSHLPKGIYFAKIFVGNQSIVQKIIKE